MTLEDVFIEKLQTDPAYVLKISRQLLEQDPNDPYVWGLVNKHVFPWMGETEEREELARQVLGLDLMNLLRPV